MDPTPLPSLSPLPMTIRPFLLLAALACAPALHAQEFTLEPRVLVAAVDTMYTVVTAEGRSDTIAISVQTLQRTTLGSEEVWEVAYRFAAGRGRMADTTYFDTLTLLPREQRRAGLERRIDVRFDQGRVLLRRGASVNGAAADSMEIARAPEFTGSQMDLVFRALPLRAGYGARIPFFFAETGETNSFTVRVEGVGIVEVRGAPAEAWRVAAGMDGFPPDVYWIDRRTRALLRIDHPGGLSTIR
jgi:hypothetical protein